MATLSESGFESKYNNSSTGLFKTGQDRGIGSDDLRTLTTDIKDSFFNVSDDLSTTATGTEQTTSVTKVINHFAVGTFRRSVEISSAQILNGNSVPIEIVPAPGTGLVLVPVMFFCFLDYNSAAYATNTNIRFEMNGVAITAIETSLLDATADKFMIRAPLDSITTTTDLKNKSIVLEVQTGNPTTGNSHMFVTCIYRIVPTSATA